MHLKLERQEVIKLLPCTLQVLPHHVQYMTIQPTTEVSKCYYQFIPPTAIDGDFSLHAHPHPHYGIWCSIYPHNLQFWKRCRPLCQSSEHTLKPSTALARWKDVIEYKKMSPGINWKKYIRS